MRIQAVKPLLQISDTGALVCDFPSKRFCTLPHRVPILLYLPYRRPLIGLGLPCIRIGVISLAIYPLIELASIQARLCIPRLTVVDNL